MYVRVTRVYESMDESRCNAYIGRIASILNKI